MWVVEAVRDFLARGAQVTLLTPAGGWVAERCAFTAARIVTYDWDGVAAQDEAARRIWTDALRDCNVALCTVHPPRGRFQCAVFAAHCIAESDLETCLVTKTGTVVPTYRREFYLPDERVCSSVIAIAAFTRGYLIETYRIPADKVTLIYQGVDLRRFRPAPALQEEGLRCYPLPPGASPVLACVGSFEPRKGQAVLLEAVAALPDAHLLLVGDGPDETRLRATVERMGLAERVHFFPFTSRPEFVFARADITVLPSLYKEGLPNVLLESMAIGVPVVASRLGGVGKVVLEGETGYTVTPGEAGQLADAIRKMWKDRAAYAWMSEQARQMMEERFDRAVQFERFLNYLESVAGKRF
jgi:glycosyltransferase involved in cell wall biosynthesis